MSGIVSRGRRGHTVVPNFRWEDPSLDPYAIRVAGWLASHADGYVADHVTRNEIGRRTGMSGERVSKSLDALAQAGIVDVRIQKIEQSQGGKRLSIEFDFDAWESQTPVATRPHQYISRRTGRKHLLI